MGSITSTLIYFTEWYKSLSSFFTKSSFEKFLLIRANASAILYNGAVMIYKETIHTKTPATRRAIFCILFSILSRERSENFTSPKQANPNAFLLYYSEDNPLG
jgi:hypothetical protein